MRALLIAVTLVLTSLPGCDDDDDCEGGLCVCDPGESCELECLAPPCTAICAGDNPRCAAVCGNGECECGEGSACEFACQSPPCHVDCRDGAACSGTCANGACTCEAGASCDFECLAGPCHVECEGDNEHCAGTCANGTCECGAGSSCRFACADGNCHVNCEAGAECLLDCSQSASGGSCTFSWCAAGEPVVCPGGALVACGTACPP